MYDLLLKSGVVVDPSQRLHSKVDIAIKDGKIARLSEGISEKEAKQVLDLSGKYVSPGLVDLHTHVYWGGTSLGVKADEVSGPTGVTTFVDAGSAGAGNFVGFKDHVIDRAKVTIYPFLHISWLGLVGAVYDPEKFVILGESFNLSYDMVAAAVEVSRAYPDLIKGVKVRLSIESSGDQGTKPLLLALRAAEEMEKPVMAHIGTPPPLRREVLPLLRKGDILTHCFSGGYKSPLDHKGRIMPEMLEARERGVIMDLGHGGSSFSYRVAEKLLEQGFYPDTISSDIHLPIRGSHPDWPGIPEVNQPMVMSKMLSLGMDLDKVIEASTYTPAKVIGCANKIGTLREGTCADILCFNVAEDAFEFPEYHVGTITCHKRFTPEITILKGEVIFNGQSGR
ncbi:MAG: amidohydrolase/deacetylase family metallohydrolase [Nitrospiraceae bacterium]|nr:amidohydrolase/deacetylase family metallohydrolase [Nitrospiraceae bacterium]